MMLNSILEKELHTQLERLPAGQQRQVLDFARALVVARPRGVAGRRLLRFAGAIESADLKAISQAVEADCEGVSDNGW